MCRDGVKSSDMTVTKNEAEWMMWRAVYVQKDNGREEKHDVQNTKYLIDTNLQNDGHREASGDVIL